jgi:hypothetical protein
MSATSPAATPLGGSIVASSYSAIALQIAPAAAVTLPAWPRVTSLFEDEADVVGSVVGMYGGTCGFLATPAATSNGAERVRALLAPHLVLRAVCELCAAVAELRSRTAAGAAGGCMTECTDVHGAGPQTDITMATSAAASFTRRASLSAGAGAGASGRAYNPLASIHADAVEGADDDAAAAAQAAQMTPVGLSLVALLRGVSHVRVDGDQARAAVLAALKSCGLHPPNPSLCGAAYGCGCVAIPLAALAAPLIAHPDVDVRSDYVCACCVVCVLVIVYMYVCLWICMYIYVCV